MTAVYYPLNRSDGDLYIDKTSVFNSKQKAMKYILILILSLTTIETFCQVTSIWKGNTPGHEVQWEYASNWSNNRIPDEFTDVIIPLDITLGKNYPVIRTLNVEVNSLFIEAGAEILIDMACMASFSPSKLHSLLTLSSPRKNWRNRNSLPTQEVQLTLK
jgi:hypothetical protein